MKSLSAMSIAELQEIKQRGYYFSYSFSAVKPGSIIPYDGDESTDQNREDTIRKIKEGLRKRDYSFTAVQKFIRYIDANRKETLSKDADVWFRSLSINEQNHYLDKDFPNRTHDLVIQNQSNITELFLINKETL